MASPVDIVNLALGHLGDDANVSNIDPSDGSAQADHAVVYYPMARDQVLCEHAWSFSTRRAYLATRALTSPDEQPGNWLYCYALPSDCLQPIAVLDAIPAGSTALTSFPPYTSASPSDMGDGVNNDDKANDFIQEVLSDGTKVIFTNVPTAILRYTKSITDTTKFTPLCVNAIARLLASFLAGPIIKGETGMKVASGHLKQYEQLDLPKAITQDVRAQRRNVYKNFTPAGIAARA